MFQEPPSGGQTPDGASEALGDMTGSELLQNGVATGPQRWLRQPLTPPPLTPPPSRRRTH
ncbi:hypothetical protein E2C01_009894 [Portunus trituberculatus]|uniref:Uncharacterized protein n=1 Tax=Portunus trituberculatus TaxID=210409 RepID=A0A5B7D6X9_PORTR|nr:hypothetical protein [Portunus trituberculatus]